MRNSHTHSAPYTEFIGGTFYTVCHLHPIGFIESKEGKWIEALSDSGPISKDRLVEVMGTDPVRRQVIVRKVKNQ